MSKQTPEFAKSRDKCNSILSLISYLVNLLKAILEKLYRITLWNVVVIETVYFKTLLKLG